VLSESNYHQNNRLFPNEILIFIAITKLKMANLLSLFIFYLSIAIYIANCEQENRLSIETLNSLKVIWIRENGTRNYLTRG